MAFALSAKGHWLPESVTVNSITPNPHYSVPLNNSLWTKLEIRTMEKFKYTSYKASVPSVEMCSRSPFLCSAWASSSVLCSTCTSSFYLYGLLPIRCELKSLNSHARNFVLTEPEIIHNTYQFYDSERSYSL